MFLADGANIRYPRSLLTALRRDLELYPVVAVVGARQVGKSTLCRLVAEERGLPQRTLDDHDVLQQAGEDPAGFLADLGAGGGFIDEVQRAPELLLAIKAVVDRDSRSGQYLLSGSSQPRVRGGVGDSLVGRAAYRVLHPLTLSELRLDDHHPGWAFLFGEDESDVLAELERRAVASGRLAWRDMVRTGGFPAAVRAPLDARLGILDNYIRGFADRDVRDVMDIESADRFESFLRLLAARTGQELNLNGMSGDLGISASTLRRWTEALRRSYMIEQIGPWSRNASQRVIKAPKVFMVDSAMALAAARETNPTGFHLENLVMTDLAVWQGDAPGRGVHHWRLASGQEVDFIVEQNGSLLPVEVKSSDAVSTGDTRHLRKFRELYPNTPRGVLLSSDHDIRVIAPGIVAAPWWGVL